MQQTFSQSLKSDRPKFQPAIPLVPEFHSTSLLDLMTLKLMVSHPTALKPGELHP